MKCKAEISLQGSGNDGEEQGLWITDNNLFIWSGLKGRVESGPLWES